MHISRRTSIIIVFLCCIILIGMSGYLNWQKETENLSAYDFELKKAPEYGDALQHINDDYTVNKEFTSHMPIAVLDMQGAEPPKTLWFNEKTMMFELVKDVEPYVEGTLSVYDGNKLNKLSDEPVQQTNMIIKRRGNSSMSYQKPQYLVKLETSMKQENALSLLGMEQNNEWILNGSMADKSMMRNYLGYRISSEIMDNTPDSRYCEVIIKNGTAYTYQGVYLLSENVRQGEGRVDIEKYSKGAPVSSFLVRRDRYDEEDIMLNTYLQEEGLTDTYIGLIYPGKYAVSEETVQYIENELRKMEQILYADNFNDYSAYSRLIDVDSFVDYFVINEYFGNYDAGQHSTYMYKDVGEKLKIGPVWDFDGAIDNYQLEEANVDRLAFYTSPWFERLVKDASFLRKVEKRYSELRRTILSDEYIDGLIEDIRGYLGSAQEREWYRWEKEYTEGSPASLASYVDDEGYVIERETTNYNQEIYKLKTVLKQHGQVILRDIKAFYKDVTYDTEKTIGQAFIFFICLSIFLFSIVYVNRREK